MKNRFFLFLLLAVFQTALSQNITVDKQKIMLGEQFQLQLKGTFTEGSINWPTFDTLDHFEILDRSKIDTQRSINGVELSQSFTVTSFDSGRWQIPALQLGLVRTKPVTIDVVFSAPFDPNQPYHDVKEIIDVEKPIGSKWYWFIVFALLLVGLFLLFFPRSKKDKTEVVLDKGAYQTALKQLDQLRAQPPAEAKQLYTSLVDIFRTYLQKRKNIHSFSKTTDDLSIQIRQLDIPLDQYQQLVQTLRLSDMVKFARFQPPPNENAESIETIRENIITIEKLPDAVQLAPKY